MENKVSKLNFYEMSSTLWLTGVVVIVVMKTSASAASSDAFENPEHKMFYDGCNYHH